MATKQKPLSSYALAILIHASQNTTLLNLYFLLGRPGLRSQTLNLLDKILSLGNFPEDNVLSIQPRSHNGGDEELRAVPKFQKSALPILGIEERRRPTC
jgi:hypothetical protein